jgi:hypothetical protein
MVFGLLGDASSVQCILRYLVYLGEQFYIVVAKCDNLYIIYILSNLINIKVKNYLMI